MEKELMVYISRSTDSIQLAMPVPAKEGGDYDASGYKYIKFYGISRGQSKLVAAPFKKNADLFIKNKIGLPLKDFLEIVVKAASDICE